MNILILGMNYAPERTSVAPFTTGLSEYLVSRGHRVFVATTFPHYPEWKVQAPYEGKAFLRESRNGVGVLRGYVYIPRKPSTLRRILYDTSLSISAFLWGLRIGDIDVILAISPPVQVGLSAWALSAFKRATFVFQVKDLAVDAAVALGMLKKPALVRLARSLEGFIYRRARKILVICQGFADNLKARGVPEAKVLVLPDWVDTEFIRPLDRHNPFRKTQQLGPSQFVVLHAGNMGAKQGLDNAIQAAKRLDNGDGVVFLLVGDGSEKMRLVDVAAREGVANVRFLPLQSPDALPQMLSAADVLLISQRASVIDTVIPSKLLTYMAAGRPIVAAVHPESEVAKYVRKAECGLIVPPEEPSQLADAIRGVYASPELAAGFGRKARAFAEEHFARKHVLQRYDEFFRGLQFSSASGPF
jgi:colanic acid biosynthesis glycosyl transferase WcaI